MKMAIKFYLEPLTAKASEVLPPSPLLLLCDVFFLVLLLVLNRFLAF